MKTKDELKKSVESWIRVTEKLKQLSDELEKEQKKVENESTPPKP